MNYFIAKMQAYGFGEDVFVFIPEGLNIIRKH